MPHHGIIFGVKCIFQVRQPHEIRPEVVEQSTCAAGNVPPACEQGFAQELGPWAATPAPKLETFCICSCSTHIGGHSSVERSPHCCRGSFALVPVSCRPLVFLLQQLTSGTRPRNSRSPSSVMAASTAMRARAFLFGMCTPAGCRLHAGSRGACTLMYPGSWSKYFGSGWFANRSDSCHVRAQRSLRAF